MQEVKQRVRNRVLKRRLGMDREEVKKASRAIVAHCQTILTRHQSSVIGCYLPIKNEVDTTLLIEQVLRAQSRVAVPRLVDGQYIFAEYTDEDLVRNVGYHDFRGAPIRIDDMRLIFCPGVAFDHLGNRLGYGGGVYDRLLSSLSPDMTKVGLCYDFQIIEELPSESHDVKMDLIITKNAVVSCSSK